MPTSQERTDLLTEFPGDEALQQVHLARLALVDAARQKKMTLGQYVRSLKLTPKNSSKR